jgi:hypothetical protein
VTCKINAVLCTLYLFVLIGTEYETDNLEDLKYKSESEDAWDPENR